MFALLENDRFKTELGLTDQQAEKLRQVFVDSWKANTKSRADLQVRRMELRELLRGDKPEREAVMKKVQEISDLRAQLLRQHVDSLLAAKSVLTPEQQKKMRSLMADRGFGRSERFQRRPGFRGGPGDPGGPGAPEGPRMPVAPEPPED
jgi:Spy/CpxP family protein refolding chaperone